MNKNIFHRYLNPTLISGHLGYFNKKSLGPESIYQLIYETENFCNFFQASMNEVFICRLQTEKLLDVNVCIGYIYVRPFKGYLFWYA